MPSRISSAVRSPSARRAFWTLLSQGLSSITNFVTSLMVARACTASEFGRFALAFSFYGLAVGFSKSVAAMPFAMRVAPDPETARSRGAAAASAGLLLGGILGVVYVLGGIGFGGEYRDALVVTGAFLALMVAQECWRTIYVAEQRPHVAAGLDLLWLVLEVPTFALVLARHADTAPPMVVAWALPGALAGLAGWWFWRRWAGPRAAWRYMRDNRDIWSFQALEYVAVMGTNQAALMTIAALGHPSHLGALRGVQTLLAPMTILVQGVGQFVLSEITRRELDRTGQAGRWATGLSVFLGAFALVWGGLLFLLPGTWGAAILGDTWPAAHSVLIPISLQFLGQGLAQGPIILMFSRADSRSVFQVSVVNAALILVLVVAGEYLFGLTGAAWGYALASLLVVPLWAWRSRTAPSQVSAAGGGRHRRG